MTKLKLFLTLLALALAATLSYSQELTPPKRNGVSIGETKVSMGKDEIFIDYRILLGEDVQSCKVKVTMYLDYNPYRKATEFSGDIGKITESGFKRIRYDLSGRKERLAGRDISFRLEVSDKIVSYRTAATYAGNGNFFDNSVADRNIQEKKAIGTKWLISAQITPPFNTLSSQTSIPASYGVMVGVAKIVGGYVSVRSNFIFTTPTRSVRTYSDVVSPTSNTKISDLKATGGFIFRANKSLYPYAGVGYGFDRHLYGSYYRGNGFPAYWCLVEDLSPQGYAAETGLISKVGPIAVSAGVSTIMFKTLSIDFGLGVMF